jgi:hypothetical protein
MFSFQAVAYGVKIARNADQSRGKLLMDVEAIRVTIRPRNAGGPTGDHEEKDRGTRTIRRLSW